MKLIISGSYDQFRQDFKSSYMNYKYLGSLPDDLRGRQCTTLVLSGTYWRRKDYMRHEEEIHEYCRQHNINIVRVAEEERTSFQIENSASGNR